MLSTISVTENYQTQPTLYSNSIIPYGEFKGMKVVDLKNKNYTSFKKFINSYEGQISKELFTK